MLRVGVFGSFCIVAKPEHFFVLSNRETVTLFNMRAESLESPATNMAYNKTPSITSNLAVLRGWIYCTTFAEVIVATLTGVVIL